jgi:preprotein translocase subunit SecD
LASWSCHGRPGGPRTSINKNVQNGIFVGFNKAFATILDANVTTFIVGAVLLTLGSGPIQAFAVTLILGLITSMFTAVICTKALVNLFYGNSKEISLG